MKEGEVKKRKKLQEGEVAYQRSQRGEGTVVRSQERKREKSEDNSEEVVVLLI